VTTHVSLPPSVDATLTLLTSQDYVADRALATVLFLALKLGRPLLLEGEAGVGKTEIAKVLAVGLGRRLIRLQCYDGLDLASAFYEWNYPKQLLAIRQAEVSGEGLSLYSDDFLIRRPLLEALSPQPGGAPVLLIDELDRADEPFEAFLLEVLSDFQATIPEVGTLRAPAPPLVIVTSNRTREIHDALKRRCLYHWVDYPTAEREAAILKAKAGGVAEGLAEQIVGFVQRLRGMDLFKSPGVAETLDWAQALVQLDAIALTPELIEQTLGVLLKYQDDIVRLRGSEALRLLNNIQAELSQKPLGR
jgi:MoxR-like ATPase